MKNTFVLLLIFIQISGCETSGEVFDIGTDGDLDADIDADSDINTDSDYEDSFDAEQTDGDGVFVGINYMQTAWAENGDIFALVRTYTYEDPHDIRSRENIQGEVHRITLDGEITVLFEIPGMSDWGLGFDAATNGSRFLIEYPEDSEYRLYDNEGTVLRTFPINHWHHHFNLSDDGRWMTYVEKEILRIELPDGIAQAVAGPGSDPALSPDNSRIAFDGGLYLHVVNADGTGQIALECQSFKTSSGFFPIIWSSDGTTIYYSSDGIYYSILVNEDTISTHFNSKDLEDDRFGLGMISNDGTKLLMGDEYDGFHVFSTEDGRLIFSILGDCWDC